MPVPIDLDPRAALPFGTIADRALDLVRTAHTAANSSRRFAGLPTGLPTLDKALGGLQAGLHILGAEPGAGKTALALNIARHAAAEHQLPVVYASFDEIPERLALKVIAAKAGLTMSDIAGGQMAPDKVATVIDQHRESLSSLSFVSADIHLTAMQLIEQLQDRLAHHQQEIGLLVVDYLQPWAAAQAQMGKGEFRLAVGKVALELRDLANKTRCPVLLVSAQNRAQQGTASMTSLRESSDLEYGADSIMLLMKDSGLFGSPVGGGKTDLALTLAKNRFGSSGLTIGLVLDGRTQRIVER